MSRSDRGDGLRLGGGCDLSHSEGFIQNYMGLEQNPSPFFYLLVTATSAATVVAAEAAAAHKDENKDDNPRATAASTVIATHNATSLPVF